MNTTRIPATFLDEPMRMVFAFLAASVKHTRTGYVEGFTRLGLRIAVGISR
jgi:hypothetical protein